MRRTLLPGMMGLGLLVSSWVFLASDLLNAQQKAGTETPAAAPDLSGYRTVETAVTTRVSMAGPARAGVAYVGIQVSADARGKLVIAEVQPDSPAAKAKLQAGDVVLQLDGQTVSKPEAFRASIHAKAPSDAVKLSLLRQDKPLEVTVTLGAVSRPMKPIAPSAQRAVLGVQVGEPKDEGVPIEQVIPGSPADKAQLKVGQIILKMDGMPLTEPAKLRDILSQKKPDDTVTLTVLIADKPVDLKVQLAEDRDRGGRFGSRDSPPLPYWKKDVYRLAVIGVELPDVKHNPKIATKEWEEALFSRNTYAKKPNTTGQTVYGSLNDYFQEQSYGVFRVTGKVFDWVEVGKKRADYSQGSGTSNRSALPAEALDKLLAREGKEALRDFDGLCFVYAGERARANRGSLYYPHSGGFTHQSKRWSYLLFAEGGPRMTTLSGYCREFGFLLGLPDLAARPENPGSEGAGVWCAMSNLPGDGRPQHLCAWCKEKLGWVKPAVIDPSVKQKLILAPVEDSAKECFKVLIKPDAGEYLLLENRRKKGFDAELPAEGLLIWRVVNDRPVLEESHGVEGAAGPRVLLQSVPYPSPANNAFTPNTTPSSRSPRGGGLPVHITEIRRLADGRITFHIGYEYQ